MSLIHLARQGFITKSALPNVTRQRGTTTGTANLMLYGAGKTHSIGTNTTFTDSSSNNFTVTRNGDTIQATNNPFTGSVYFDGNGDYLSVANNTAFDLGTGNFTIEMFVYIAGNAAQNSTGNRDVTLFSTYPSSGVITGYSVFILGNTTTTGTAIAFESAVSNSFYPISIATNVSQNAWHHVAFVRSGTTTTIYFNGVSVTSGVLGNQNVNTGGNSIKVGRMGYTGYTNELNGYITNLRVVKGTAVYTANFTPPTSPLTAITNTQLLLLTAQQAPFRDSSANAFTVTANGNAAGSGLEPFPVNYAGSAYFDGTGDDVTVPTNAAFNFGTGDFTVECWVYQTANSGVRGVLGTHATYTGGGWGFYINNGVVNFQVFVNGTTNSDDASNSTAISLNTWTHIAAVRSSGNLTVYVNGVGGTAVTSTKNGDNTASFYLGVYEALLTNYRFTGYISNARVIKGTAQYTANFTPPTAPLTAVTNTSLLLLTNNVGPFVDTSANGFPVLRNGDTVQTGFSPFTGQPSAGSAYFDGTGDYLSTSINNNIIPTTGNFTFETWIYPTSTSQGSVIAFRGNSSAYAAVRLLCENNQLFFLASTSGSSWAISTSYIGSAPINNWHHVAITRNGGTFTLFLNGTSIFTSTAIASGTSLMTGSYNYIGVVDYTAVAGSFIQYFTGYISNFRVISGTALYTSNFTPATAPLPAVPNTSLLLNTDNYTIANSTPTYLPVTVNGNTTVSTAQYPTGMNRSIYFDGANSTFLRVATNSIFTFSADFTLEFWFYGASQAKLLVYSPNFTIENNAGGVLKVWTASTGDNVLTAYPANQWNHFALARTGSACKAFLNGTQVGSFTNSSTTNFDFSNGTIGNRGDGIPNWGWNGYISNFRTIKGSGLYSGNFTPEALPMSLSVTVPAFVTNNIYGVYQLA